MFRFYSVSHKKIDINYCLYYENTMELKIYVSMNS